MWDKKITWSKKHLSPKNLNPDPLKWEKHFFPKIIRDVKNVQKDENILAQKGHVT